MCVTLSCLVVWCLVSREENCVNVIFGCLVLSLHLFTLASTAQIHGAGMQQSKAVREAFGWSIFPMSASSLV